MRRPDWRPVLILALVLILLLLIPKPNDRVLEGEDLDVQLAPIKGADFGAIVIRSPGMGQTTDLMCRC
jgi:hypothetical protein